jgi:Glycosyltransferases, probably involved in cell wall biogenesis
MLFVVFWLLAIFAIYSYFLYPVILKILVKDAGVKDVDTSGEANWPKISLVITAFNEEGRIRQKLANTLQLKYAGELEIIVASDCSDDNTDDIVREYADKNVLLVRAQERLGKENAQLTAIKEVSGEIVVFSDTATEIPEDALDKLVQHFADPEVGGVSSEDRFISQDGSVAGEGAYVKYEMWLRQQESKLAGLVGLSGSFFAARKEVCSEWDIHSPSDFNTALNCARLGYRAITAPDVLGYYQDP